MQVYIGILGLTALPGALACAVDGLCHKDKINIQNIVKTYIFYSIMFYVVLSLFKTVLGYGMAKLADTFEEISGRTYLHYSLPLTAICIVVPLLMKKFLHEKTQDFMRMTLSLYVGIYSAAYLFLGVSNNLFTVCIAAVSVISAFFIVLYYNKEIEYCNAGNIKQRLAQVIPVILLWVVMMIWFLPNELYLGNVSDMAIPYDIFVRTLALGGGAYFAFYTVCLVYFLTQRQLKAVCRLVFAVTLTGYLQGMILNGNLYAMDGTRQTWSTMTIMVNALIWFAAAGFIVSLAYIIKRAVDKVYSAICIYLSLVLLLSWGYMGLTTETVKAENDYELTTKGRFELDPDHNVIVFVLDWYDVQIAEQILAEEEDFLAPLKDFTWYKNMTSLYAFTTMSIPYMLSGVEWQYDMSEEDYTEYVFEGDSLLRDIAAQNYDIGVYTGKRQISESMHDIVNNYTNLAVQGWDYYGILEQMIVCSKYKNYPFALKGRYWYTDSQLSSDLQDNLRESYVHNTVNDAPFYEGLRGDGIKVKNSKYDGVYRFYHLYGAHPPFEPDLKSQGRSCMNIVYEYLEQLKAEGLYDDATIIITADHGHNYLTPYYEERLDKYGFDHTSRPIMFVKQAGQTNEDGMEISMAPVSHAQLAATVMKAVCGDSMGYGETLDEVEEDRQCERTLIVRRHDDIPYVKYVIDGYAGDWNNWRIEAAE